VSCREPKLAIKQPGPARKPAGGGNPCADREPPFPIVGIGASAGGLGAFEAFFSGLPADQAPGMAFVLIQHLAPDHESLLSELVRRFTRMPVYEAAEGMVVARDSVYVIPPNCDLAIIGGSLHLLEPSAPRGQRLPIDFFLRSLALDQGERAICIILSGTGGDGAQGLRAVKGGGGLVLAQAPESTEFDGMPRSALATGLVDFELPPEQLAERLLACVQTASFAARLRSPRPRMAEEFVRKVAFLLHARTGHDFSQYKPNTLQRRIERRMAVHRAGSVQDYLGILQATPEELDALFRDLLIGVTGFFRDPEIFRVLEEEVVPRLFEGRADGAPVRVWCAGCSTGEEAYSLAILLHEHMERLQRPFTVQVFATDIDAHAISLARGGVFSPSASAGLSEDRLSRYFTLEPDGSGYRAAKAIRDLLVFSVQDLIKDPPFSRIDLLSCRNLLIYMGAGLQKKVIPLFHYALNPGGFLFQGSSETVGDFGHLFAPIDRKSRIFRRREEARGGLPDPVIPPPAGVTARPAAPPLRAPHKPSLREITEQALLDQVAPVCALVDAQGGILYLRGRSGQFLEPMAGVTGTGNILKMARDGLRRELATALHNAARNRHPRAFTGLRVGSGSGALRVDLAVSPVRRKSPDPELYLVILEQAKASRVQEPQAGSSLEADALRLELRAKEEVLRASNEELETANEDLKSSIEELQSLNEEVQSANEELETSKEELQSVNEELTTVNTELQAKVLESSRAVNDMNNLLAGTGIGTIFVDSDLRILRFTPAATSIINLIPTDVGRPVGHVVTNLVGYDTLPADTQAVLDTLVPLALEVRTREGRWFSMRIQLYRTLENVIEGAVLTFVDITGFKGAHTSPVEADLDGHRP